jgi:hypothetical protein
VERKRAAYKVLVRKHKGRIPSGSRMCCWDDTEMEAKYDMIYLLIAIGLSSSGSSTVHIYTQTIHKKNQTNNT